MKEGSFRAQVFIRNFEIVIWENDSVQQTIYF